MRNTGNMWMYLFALYMFLLISSIAKPIAAQETVTTKIAFTKAQNKPLILYKGQSYSLGTTVTPTGTVKGNIKYTLSKKKIISIRTNGKIKALNVGQVTVTAKLKKNSKIKAKLKIKVISKKKYKKIKKIIPKKKNYNLKVGECAKISVQIKPAKASNKNLQYTSADMSCVRVNHKGQIFAMKEGTTKITIRALDGSKKKAQIKITVKDKEYEEEYIHLEMHQKDTVVNEIHPTLTGTYSTNGNLKSITYNIQDFSSENATPKAKGTAITGNGTWEILQIPLSPGDNYISVMAETYTGIKTEKTIKLTYDRGKLDVMPCIENMEGVSVDADGKLKIEKNCIQTGTQEGDIYAHYLNNRLFMYFVENISKERKEEILTSMHAKEIGMLHTVCLSQVELSQNFEEIEDFMNYISILCEKYPEILAAEPEWVYIEPKETLYNDTWNHAKWDTNYPADENWWAETVNAPLAWGYAKKMQPVRIGVIDDGFDTCHEDLQIYFSSTDLENENSIEKHGTHVAGIIGARADNGKGITGLAHMNKVYGYDWHPSAGQNWTTSAKIQDVFVEAVESGCKVINLSLGTSGNLPDSSCNYWKPLVWLWGKTTSVLMGKLLEKNFDFVVVQSAGNGAKDGIGVDAHNNGHFASITEENCYASSKVTKDEILNRILIVGAAEQTNTGYQQTSFSNAGENVNIAAPGRKIYSTLPENTYGNLSGTSMAAPITAATASMVWAVNPAFTGKEVTEILLQKTNNTACDNANSPYTAGEIPMVNAGMAVEDAINRTEAEKIGENAYRIVLKWNRIPEDLDAHLRAEDVSGEDVHVYFNAYIKDSAYLDIDETLSYGMETITITKPEQLKNIRYAVHNYTDRDSNADSANASRLSESAATVSVYKGNTLLKIYQVPKNQKGSVWNVFSISENGEIIDENTMDYEFYSSRVLPSLH
ncbi:MAG: S8 family serine peptidase [Lachnospiraceae bacterium]|nr:S8 family serine peptidase [Lachnospiraceae bacterium]